jgi:enoyl-CoA hydratase
MKHARPRTAEDNMTDTHGVVIRRECEPAIVVVMNRPDRLNALNIDLVTALHDTFSELDEDGGVRVIILTGAGRGLCAGADIGGSGVVEEATPRRNRIAQKLFFQQHLASLHKRIHRFRQPVIAAINGPAVGGGVSLSLACDLRFCSDSACFGALFITLGISARDMGMSHLLPRLGASRAPELMLTGQVLEADEEGDTALVLEVTTDQPVVDRALETARLIKGNSPLAVWMTKETVWQKVEPHRSVSRSTSKIAPKSRARGNHLNGLNFNGRGIVR